MALRRWDPFFEDILSLRERIDRIFDESIDTLMRPTEREIRKGYFTPTVDIYEDEKEIIITAELPGIQQKDIEIEMKGDRLTIKGERKLEKEEKKDRYVKIERQYGSFSRSFTMYTPIKKDQIKAQYKDGILEVRLPKQEVKKEEAVKIKVE